MLYYIRQNSNKFHLLFLFFAFFSVDAQDYRWGRQFGNGQRESINAIAIDDNGNSYVLGESTSYSYDMDPGPGRVIIENNAANISGTICFLTKLDADGNYVWGKIFSRNRSTSDRVIDLKIGSDGNLYAGMVLSKEYNGNVTITNPNFMLVKLDLDGNELMAKSIRNHNAAFYNAPNIANFDLDAENNVYFTGYFVDNVSLDPANTAFNLSANFWGNFVLKMNSSGNFLWKDVYDYQSCNFNDIKIGPDGKVNLLIETYTAENHTVVELKKLDPLSGNLINEKKFTYLTPHAFHVSQNGNIIISGGRGDVSHPPTDVDPSLNTVFTVANNFLLWYTPAGDFIELKEFSTSSLNLRLNVIESDEHNNYYFAGYFYGTLDADPSANIFNLISSNFGSEGLTVKFNSNFNFESAFRLGQADVLPTPYDLIYHLHFLDLAIKNENIYYAGLFAGYGDLDPSTNVDGFEAVHSGTLSDDGFIIKLGPCDLAAPIGNTDQYFCILENTTVQNLAPQSGSIHWYDSLTGGNLLANSTHLVDGTVYYASRTIPSCSGTPLRLAVTAHISPSPLDPVVTNQVFCGSDNATLSSLSVSGMNLKWYSNLTDLTPLSTNTLLTNGTTYYVSQSVGTCESNRIPVTASVITTALPITDSTPFFCQNITLFLNQFINLGDITITGQNIKWYDALTGGNLLPLTTILYNGTIYYASQTVSGCESARVAVSPVIQETLSPTGFAVQQFCDTQTLTLRDFVLTGTDVVFYDQRVGGSILPYSTTLMDGTVYWASQTVNGCESYVRLPVIPDILNGIPAHDFQTSLCDDLNDGRETVDLSIYNADLILNPSAYTFSYYSSFNGATTENASDKITDFQNHRLNAGENIVYARVAFNGSCFKIVELKLNVIASPILSMRDKFSLCENSSVTIFPDSGFQYEWSTGSHATSLTLGQAGNYWVKVTKNHGSFSCSTTKNFEVVLSNKATITKIDIKDWTSNNNMITVLVSGLGDYEYSIDCINFQDSNQFFGLASGEYTVYVNDKNGCLPASETIYLLTYPKFFTPNNDGSNDFWKIKFSTLEPGLSVKIFDRYGKFIKELSHNTAGWDGILNGKPLPSTDYWFVVTRANGKEHRGHFSLKR